MQTAARGALKTRPRSTTTPHSSKISGPGPDMAAAASGAEMRRPRRPRLAALLPSPLLTAKTAASDAVSERRNYV